MATYKGGVTFEGDPEEMVLVSPATIRAAIPDEAAEWRDYLDRVYGYSQPSVFMKKGQIFDYVLNAWARLYLPQYTFVGFTIYEAAHYFLLANDMRADNQAAPDAVLGFWTVTAQGLVITETTNEADPCYHRMKSETGTYSYFGWTPRIHKAVPYPGPCKLAYAVFEIEQRNGLNNNNNNDAFRMRFSDGKNETTWCKGGGFSAELITMEVTEGGQLFVGLPQLPPDVPYPPPLVGRVVDYGPPGPAGPPGPRGPAGQDGQDAPPVDYVAGICGLPDEGKEAILGCLGAPVGGASYLDLVVAASPVDVKQAQQIILETAPEVVLPKTELILETGTTPELTAAATGAEGWALKLGLPLAVLLALDYLKTKIAVTDCNEAGQPYPRYIDFPILSFQGASQRDVFQEIFRQFSILMQCCKPCQPSNWKLLGRYKNYQYFRPADDFQAVRLVVPAQPLLGINSWYHDMTIHKYGNLRWLYDDGATNHNEVDENRSSELHFWNSDDAEFHLPGQNVVGFEISTEWEFEYFVYILPLFKNATGPWY